MAGATFLHGVEVIEIDDGPRSVRTVRSSVIGIVGTAPNANPAAFPLDTPTVIAGSRRTAALLDTLGTREGTLPNAVESILDQIGAVVVVVRVEEGADEAETLANILGGVAPDGSYRGLHALMGAQSAVGLTPRILLAPGFTSDRPLGVSEIMLANAGTGYTSALVEITGGGGEGAIRKAGFDLDEDELARRRPGDPRAVSGVGRRSSDRARDPGDLLPQPRDRRHFRHHSGVERRWPVP